jgi:hypothetical protein
MKTYSYNKFLQEEWVIKLIEYISTDVIKYNMDNSFYTMTINNVEKSDDINKAVSKIVDTLDLLPSEIGMLNIKIEKYLANLLEWGTIWFSFNFETKKFDIKESITDDDRLAYNITMLFDDKSYLQRLYECVLKEKNSGNCSISVMGEDVYTDAAINNIKMLTNIPFEYYKNNSSLFIDDKKSIVDTGLFYLIEKSLNDIIKKPLMSKFSETDFTFYLNKENNILNEYKKLDENCDAFFEATTHVADYDPGIGTKLSRVDTINCIHP